MITVFVVLLLVVITGRLLIRVVNGLENGSEQSNISSSKIAAITAAVAMITQGKGRITKIEKD